MRIYAIACSFLAVALLAGCGSDSPVRPPNGEQFSWVAIDPIQCLGNPWEQDWLEKHDWDYTSYPWDADRQLAIIEDYYRRMGIGIYESRRYRTAVLVCCACSCANGYTVYLDVCSEDVPLLLTMGFRLEHPVRFLDYAVKK